MIETVRGRFSLYNCIAIGSCVVYVDLFGQKDSLEGSEWRRSDHHVEIIALQISCRQGGKWVSTSCTCCEVDSEQYKQLQSKMGVYLGSWRFIISILIILLHVRRLLQTGCRCCIKMPCGGMWLQSFYCLGAIHHKYDLAPPASRSGQRTWLWRILPELSPCSERGSYLSRYQIFTT